MEGRSSINSLKVLGIRIQYLVKKYQEEKHPTKNSNTIEYINL